ncbi:hypothetical protein [Phenylobacterium sp.]|uniref:hypothetical protein n=1 Tax=Phenylobacterium sp. TaxID=1871053 RepID=UPI0035B25387
MLADATIFRDKNTAPGDWPIDVAATQRVDDHGVVTPAPIPTAISLTSGNSAGQFAFNTGTGMLDNAGVGLAPGTYALVFTFTYALEAPYDTHQATLHIEVPPNVRYVDNTRPDDVGDGLTPATAWKHMPGDPDATNGPAALKAAPPIATQKHLIVLKAGQIVRSTGFSAVDNCLYASLPSYGGPTKAELSTLAIAPAGTAATSGEVYGNPNLANIQKYPFGSTHSQPFRNGSEMVFPAQYPPAGANKFIDSQEPRVDGSRGMRRLASANIVLLAEATGSYTYQLTWAELASQFPGISFQGWIIFAWAGANHIRPATITTHDPATGVLTFTLPVEILIDEYGASAFNIAGHPALINAPGQRAWDGVNTFAWLSNGAQPLERSLGKKVLDAEYANFAAFRLKISGGYTASSNDQGGGVFGDVATNSGVSIAGVGRVHACDFAYMASDVSQAAAVRVLGSGISSDWEVERCTCQLIFRSSAFRFSAVENWRHVLRANYIRNMGFTGYYMVNARYTLDEHNISDTCQSTHGNGRAYYVAGYIFKADISSGSTVATLTDLPADKGVGDFYQPGREIRVTGAGVGGEDLIAKIGSITATTATLDTAASTTVVGGSFGGDVNRNCTVRYNETVNTTRPLTAHVTHDMLITGNIFEMDGESAAAFQYWSNSYDTTVTRDMFMRRRGMVSGNADAMVVRGTGLVDHCVLDGCASNPDETFTWTNNLVTNVLPSNDANIAGKSPTNKVSTISTHTSPWSGALTSEMRRSLGYGRIGATQIVDNLANVVFPNTFDVPIGSVAQSDWSQLVTDSATRTITPPPGVELFYGDNSAGANPQGPFTAATSVPANKYLRLRRTVSGDYFTRETVTFDLGGGITSTWTTRTLRSPAWTVAVFTSDDQFEQHVSGAWGAASRFATIFLPEFKKGTWSTTTIVGPTTGSIYLSIETLSTGGLRFRVRNGGNQTLAQFNSPAIDTDPHDYKISIDTSQGDSPIIQFYVDDQSKPISSLQVGNTAGNTSYAAAGITDRFIGFDKSATYRMLYGFSGESGGVFFHNKLLDLSDVANRAKLTALQMLPDGSGVFGEPPLCWVTGAASDWNSTAAVLQRGSGPKIARRAGTVTSGASSAPAWPSYVYATALALSGAPNGNVGLPATYTVGLNGAVGTATVVTLSDGGAGGTFSPASLTFPPEEEATPKTFSYTPASTGAKTITISAAGIAPASQPLQVNAAPATAVLANLVTVGQTVPITIGLNGANLAGAVITPGLSGVAGTFSESPLTIEAGTTSATLYLTFLTAGTATLTFTNGDGLANPAPLVLTVG